MASSLALAGKKPVVAIYSTFMQRAIDQAIVNVGLQKAHVVFCLDRAGLVGDDGPTHHGVFDLVYLRMIPNMRILAPSNDEELRMALRCAMALEGPWPFAIRAAAPPSLQVHASRGRRVMPSRSGTVPTGRYSPWVAWSMSRARLPR